MFFCDYLLQRQFFLYFSSLKRFFSVNLHNQLFVYDSFRKELLVFFIWQKKKNELWSQKGIPFLKGCLLPNPRKNLWKKFEEKSKIRYYILINCFSWKLNTISRFIEIFEHSCPDNQRTIQNIFFFKNTLIFQISAQESRRKKKEYMDCLERRMQSLIEELEAYKHRFTNLEGQNISLRSQVQQLQAQVSQCNCTNK